MVSLLFRISNGHKKALILLHEIYGLNNDISCKARDFSKLECDVFCPDLLSNKLVFDYDDEAKAYSNFIDNVGFDQAYNVVMNLYKELVMTYDEIYIVGYSVGATVAWMMSEVIDSGKIVCFYGSRIRDYIYILPKCQVAVFFALNESFNVRELISILEQKKNINIIDVFDAKHGFANSYNSNYERSLADEAWATMLEFLDISVL